MPAMVGTTTKKIQIITEYMTRMNQRASRQVGQSLGYNRRQMYGLNRVMAQTGTTGAQLTQRFHHLGYRISQNGNIMNMQNNRLAKYDQMLRDVRGTQQKTAKSTQRFRFEYLSLMFAGMALQRMFGGYISQVMKMMGITDMISILMSMMLIPAFKELLPYIIRLFKWFTALTPAQKKNVGQMMILITVFGSLLMIVSMVGLALQGLTMVLTSLPLLAASTAFLGLVTIIGYFLVKFGGLLGAIKAMLASVVGFVLLLIMAFVRLHELMLQISTLGRYKPGAWLKVGGVAANIAEWGGVARMQEGGIVKRPTLAMIGEAGPEAVVPLNSSAFSPTINVYADVADTIDIDLLARRIFDEIQLMQARRWDIR